MSDINHVLHVITVLLTGEEKQNFSLSRVDYTYEDVVL